MLLMNDLKGNTPLDIAIAANSPRCISIIMEMTAQGCQETLGKLTNLYK